VIPILDRFAKSDVARSVLHIGAGHGDALDAYVENGVDAFITLVEPNPELAANLTRKASHLANVTVIPAAVGRQAGRAPLNIYNFSELSSLRVATGALELLPGLQVVDTPKVDVLSFADVLKLHRTNESSPNLLVLDAPGEEAALLEAAIASGAIGRFQHLTVYCGQGPLFEGAASAPAIVEMLEPLFFDLHDAVPDTLGRVCLHFRSNAARAARQALEAEQDALRARLAQADDLAARHAETAEKRRLRNEELKAALGEREKELQARAAEAAEKREAADRLGARVEELERRLDEREKAWQARGVEAAAHIARIEELTAELARRDAEVAGLAETAEKRRARIEDLKASLAARDETSSGETGKLAAQTAQIDDLNGQLKEAQHQSSAAKKRLAEVEHELSSANVQRTLYERELIKLEAQMDLIRDLMALPGKAHTVNVLPVNADND